MSKTDISNIKFICNEALKETTKKITDKKLKVFL